MKGDFSRFIFDPKKHYTSALMQQGRVLSDADWNVQQSMNQHRVETEAQDVIGLCGVPEDVGGFALDELLIFSFETQKRNWDLALSPGRIYVDGILCELELIASVPAIELVIDNNEGIGVKVSALIVDGQAFEKNQWIEIFGKDLLVAKCLISEVDSASKTLKFSRVNRLSNTYVNSFNQGSDRRVRHIITYTNQPDYPNPVFAQLSSNGIPPALKLEDNKTYLVYLDVWQWHRTSLDDSRIREVALGGSDTTTRLQTIWQVKLLEVTAFDPIPTLNLLQKVKDKLQQLESEQRRPGGDRQIAEQLRRGWGLINSFLEQFPDIAVELRQEQLKNTLGELIANLEFLNLQQINIVAEQGALKTELTRLETSPETATCTMTYPEWDRFTAVSTGTLNARTQTPQSDDNPCLLPPTAGFQRLENQLYRFEIHKGGLFKSGSTDTVIGKWSRDNGSVVTAVEKISGHEIIVQTVGPDDVLGFANGQWVEIIDDRLELNGQPGEVIQITNVDPATRVITLQTAPAPLSTNPEGIDKARHPKLRRWDSVGAFPLSSGWIPLEGGIEIQLSEGTYKTGDYWLIPARTVMGEIEWPPYEVPNLNPIPQLPLGIKHHYCRLAILKFADQNLKILEDCRKLFPPLTKVKVDSGIHITEVFALTPNLQPVPLKNDTEIAFEMLTQELRIVCDRPIDRQVFRSNNQPNQPHPACFITINLPFPTSQVDKSFWGVDLSFGYQPVILNAETEVDDNIIFWRPAITVKEWLQRLNERLEGLPEFRDGQNVRILVNLTLKGNFIWAADDSEIYLDGEAFGTPDGETASNLRLPSGDGKRGGDFEMWFWLAPPPPPRLVALQITPDTVQAGSSARGVVTLDKPALAGGVQVSLSSDNNAVASVSASVTIIAGAISAEFTITTSSPGFNTTLPVPINASLATVGLQKVLSVQGPRLG